MIFKKGKNICLEIGFMYLLDNILYLVLLMVSVKLWIS